MGPWFVILNILIQSIGMKVGWNSLWKWSIPKKPQPPGQQHIIIIYDSMLIYWECAFCFYQVLQTSKVRYHIDQYLFFGIRGWRSWHGMCFGDLTLHDIMSISARLSCKDVPLALKKKATNCYSLMLSDIIGIWTSQTMTWIRAGMIDQ